MDKKLLERPTVFRQFLPDTIDSSDLRLSTQFTFRADFLRHPGDLTPKHLQLIHHGIDSALERRNFGIHFDGMYLDLFAQIAVCDGGDNAAYLLQGFLEGLVCLLVLLQLPLQCAHVFMLNSIESSRCLFLLLVEPLADTHDCFFLAPDLLRLLLYMIPQLTQFFLTEGAPAVISRTTHGEQIEHPRGSA